MLEIGCGQGSVGARLAQHYHYLGVEPDRASWGLAQQRIRAVGHGEVRNITSDEIGAQRFDLVCAFEVLEHIEDDAAAVKQRARPAAARGRLLLSVPRSSAGTGRPTASSGTSAATTRRRWPRCWRLRLRRDRDPPVRLPAGLPAGDRPQRHRAATARRDGGHVHRRAHRRVRPLPPAVGRGLGAATRWGTAPFRLLQRGFPHSGPGLVVRARLAD